MDQLHENRSEASQSEAHEATRAFLLEDNREGESFLPRIPLEESRPPEALYLHVPFCKQRCNYCDFHTQAVLPGAPELRTYTEGMVLAIRRAAKAGLLGHIKTVYIGGGTPSFIGSRALTEILYTLSLSMHLNDDVECSMEANPESLDERLVRDMWALGVNRLSLGVQSFNDGELEALGRIHNAQQARDAVAAACTRFENVSIDLMCGIPRQSLESFRASLEEAIALGVAHISVYPLTIEDATPFGQMLAKGEMPDIDPDFQADCMELAADVLTGAGFARYEVASYARPGFECRHNKAYWTGLPYLGLGPGAVSMAQNETARIRFDMDGEIEQLSSREALAEDLMLGMRMTKGLGPSLLQAAQSAFPHFAATVEELMGQGLVAYGGSDGEHLVPTQKGWLCGNELYGALLNLA